MAWYGLIGFLGALVLAISVLMLRRAELKRLSAALDQLAEAKQRGSHRARLQYPHIDLSRCIGCATCIRACPEEGVLDLVHGQAVVVHGARCVGHGRCAEACPVEGISLTLADLQDRRDLPALSASLESPQVEGLFLAGEVTGYALIRTAIQHGTNVVDEVAARLSNEVPSSCATAGDRLDLCIVGAGPAGIAAALRAKQHGLRVCILEQDSLGGTVSKYPRRKLVMTQPVELPLYGKLKRTSYSKEELLELWEELVRKYELPVRHGTEFRGLTREDNGFRVQTNVADVRAKFVCLALGRRGSPRKLGVPGEELPKVCYSLIDAQAYQGRRVLVVGGGDSAVEAALGLAEQPGNRVTLSYRKRAFVRIKSRNEQRLHSAIHNGRIKCLLSSHVRRISDDHVELSVTHEDGSSEAVTIENDDVFVMIGGIPPFQLLESCGVSFDPADRESPPPLIDQGTGLLGALWTALLLSCCIFAWVLLFRAYYAAPRIARPFLEAHAVLRSSSPLGIACGVAGTAMILANLAYLARRSGRLPLPGSLKHWMTSHVVTGILALLLILIHSAMDPRQTVGGHALVSLAVLVITGAIGRYFYSFVPRAANGSELELDELRRAVAAESAHFDRMSRSFGDEVRNQIQHIVSSVKWRSGFVRRLLALLRTQSSARRVRRQLRERGQAEGLTEDELGRLEALVVRAYRTALASAHYEDLRALLNSWRFIHRWVALLMVLLAALHIWTAIRYGSWWR